MNSSIDTPSCYLMRPTNPVGRAYGLNLSQRACGSFYTVLLKSLFLVAEFDSDGID